MYRRGGTAFGGKYTAEMAYLFVKSYAQNTLWRNDLNTCCYAEWHTSTSTFYVCVYEFRNAIIYYLFIFFCFLFRICCVYILFWILFDTNDVCAVHAWKQHIGCEQSVFATTPITSCRDLNVFCASVYYTNLLKFGWAVCRLDNLLAA